MRRDNFIEGERIRLRGLGSAVGESETQGLRPKDHFVFDFVEGLRSAGLEGDEVDDVSVRTVREKTVRNVLALPDVKDVVRSKLQIAARHFVREGAVGSEDALLSFAADDVTETDLFGGDFCFFVFHRVFA